MSMKKAVLESEDNSKFLQGFCAQYKSRRGKSRPDFDFKCSFDFKLKSKLEANPKSNSNFKSNFKSKLKPKPNSKSLLFVAIAVLLVFSLLGSGCARSLFGGNAQQNNVDSTTAESALAEERQATVNLGKTTRFFDYLKTDSTSLYAFLQEMPKGASLQCYPADKNGQRAEISADLHDDQLVWAVETFYAPLFNRAMDERISYVEIIARPTLEQLQAIYDLKSSIVEHENANGNDWNFRYHFIWPVSYDSNIDKFRADLDDAVAAYYDMSEQVAAIALEAPNKVEIFDSQDFADFASTASGPAVTNDITGTATDASADDTLVPLTSEYVVRIPSKEVFEQELEAVNDAYEASLEDHEDRPLDFIDTSMGSEDLALYAAGDADSKQFTNVLERTHAVRLTGLNALLYQQDVWSLLEQLKTDNVTVMLSLSQYDIKKENDSKANDEDPFLLLKTVGVPVGILGDTKHVGAKGTFAGAFATATERYDLGYTDIKELALASIRYSLQDEATKTDAIAALEQAFIAFEKEAAKRSDESNWK